MKAVQGEETCIFLGSFKVETNSNTVSAGGRDAKELTVSLTSRQVEDFYIIFSTPVTTPAIRSCSTLSCLPSELNCDNPE